jgi:hypothetical protein
VSVAERYRKGGYNIKKKLYKSVFYTSYVGCSSPEVLGSETITDKCANSLAFLCYVYINRFMLTICCMLHATCPGTQG